MQRGMGVLTGAQEYPQGERLITNALVRRIATAETWEDIHDAAMALNRVQRMAMEMRTEMLHHTRNQARAAAPPSMPYQYSVQNHHQPSPPTPAAQHDESFDDLPFNPNVGEEIEPW